MSSLSRFRSGKSLRCGRIFRSLFRAELILIAVFVCGESTAGAWMSTQLWSDQQGSDRADLLHGLSVDSAGSVIISGATSGTIGQAAFGGDDIFVRKYSATGQIEWTRQLGSSVNDSGYSCASGPNGVSYVAGYTSGALDGASSLGVADAFLMSFDSSGTALWTRQFGTFAMDLAYSVAVAANGDVLVAGKTYGDMAQANWRSYDAFVRRYTSAGEALWTAQIGTIDADDEALCVTADGAGNVLVSGRTKSALDGANAGLADGFVSKFSASGSLLWTRQLGTATDDQFSDVVTDEAGNIYLGGQSAGDAWLAKYDSDGDQTWLRQFGTALSDNIGSLCLDDAGNILVFATLGGTSAGNIDAAVLKYSPDGTLLDTLQIATAKNDYSVGLAFEDGRMYVGLTTYGSLYGQNAGSADPAVAVYVPEPASICVLLAAAMFVIRRRQ